MIVVYVKTVLIDTLTSPTYYAQESDSYSHKKTHVIIEQTFGRWKQRFHCLHGETRMAPGKVCTVIVACGVLHNMAKR